MSSDENIKKLNKELSELLEKEINKRLLNKINDLKYIHDKSEPIKNISKKEPLCTILFKAKTFSDSYFGSLKVADEIKKIIK